MSEIPDFSIPQRETLKFKIDDDVFEAHPQIGANLLLETTQLSDFNFSEDMTPEEQANSLKAAREFNLRCFRFVQDALLPDSAKRFAERLTSATEPISMTQVTDVYRMLVQAYSQRPTEPPTPSTNGQGGTGESSTVSVRTVDLTSSDLTPRDLPI